MKDKKHNKKKIIISENDSKPINKASWEEIAQALWDGLFEYDKKQDVKTLKRTKNNKR